MQSGVLIAVLRSGLHPRQWLHPLWADFKSNVIMTCKYPRPWSNIHASNTNCTHANVLPVDPFKKYSRRGPQPIIIQSQNLGLAMTCRQMKHGEGLKPARTVMALALGNGLLETFKMCRIKRQNCIWELHLTKREPKSTSVPKHKAMEYMGCEGKSSGILDLWTRQTWCQLQVPAALTRGRSPLKPTESGGGWTLDVIPKRK